MSAIWRRIIAVGSTKFNSFWKQNMSHRVNRFRAQDVQEYIRDQARIDFLESDLALAQAYVNHLFSFRSRSKRPRLNRANSPRRANALVARSIGWRLRRELFKTHTGRAESTTELRDMVKQRASPEKIDFYSSMGCFIRCFN